MNKEICFRDDSDRELFVGLLEEHAAASGCDVHAYVLMTNHIHLLATPAAMESPGMLMKRVLQRYVQHYNRRYERCGTLWSARYKSSLVDTETYLLRCYRYVELNPVRAGIATTPGEYRWSSYVSNGLAQPRSWLVPHEEFRRLGRDAEARASAYRGFVSEGIPLHELQMIRIAMRGGFPLGGEQFVQRLKLEHGIQFGRGRTQISAR